MNRFLWLLLPAAFGCASEKQADPSQTDTASSEPAGDSGQSGTNNPCDTGQLNISWSHGGEGFFRNYCTACHSISSPNRYGAPEGVDFDTLADVRAHAGAIRYAVFDAQTMPLGGGVPEDQLDLLLWFLDCGLAP